MLSSTSVGTAEDGTNTYVVPGHVRNATGFFSRLTPDSCLYIGGGTDRGCRGLRCERPWEVLASGSNCFGGTVLSYLQEMVKTNDMMGIVTYPNRTVGLNP